MASIPTHMLVGAALGCCCASGPDRNRVLVVGALCAAVPDLDGIGYRMGVPYESMLGHRGLSHSIVFALAFAAIVVALTSRRGAAGMSAPVFWGYLALATLSHGVLDAMTSGGRGVAFLAPLSGERIFFPWRPIRVSPMSIRGFMSGRGLAVLRSEAIWVWIPALVIAAVGVRRYNRPNRDQSTPATG
jgi:inner membrane protein